MAPVCIKESCWALSAIAPKIELYAPRLGGHLPRYPSENDPGGWFPFHKCLLESCTNFLDSCLAHLSFLASLGCDEANQKGSKLWGAGHAGLGTLTAPPPSHPQSRSLGVKATGNRSTFLLFPVSKRGWSSKNARGAGVHLCTLLSSIGLLLRSSTCDLTLHLISLIQLLSNPLIHGQ